jgi:peptide/nickel transport system permease protein
MTAALATPTAAADTAPAATRRSRWPRSAKLNTGLLIVAFFVLAAIIGPLLAHTPNAVSYDRLLPPGGHYWLGTTNTGQDIFQQLLTATSGSVYVGLLVGFFATAASVLVGVLGGYTGGWIDEALSLVSNVFLVLPGLPLVILITDFSDAHGPLTIAAVISLTSWAGPARVLRAQTLSLRNRDYVDAARVSGEPHWRIMTFQILPNLLPVIAAQLVFSIIGGILIEAGLAFLGLGGIGGSSSWGSMLYFAQNGSALQLGAWWWFIPPGLCIAILATGLSLINFGIDERINPRLRKEEK